MTWQISLLCSVLFFTGICCGTHIQLTNPSQKSQLSRAIVDYQWRGGERQRWKRQGAVSRCVSVFLFVFVSVFVFADDEGWLGGERQRLGKTRSGAPLLQGVVLSITQRATPPPAKRAHPTPHIPPHPQFRWLWNQEGCEKALGLSCFYCPAIFLV